MVAKLWKKVLLVILLVACLYNVVNKLVHKQSLEDELNASVIYMQEEKNQQ